MLFLQGGATLQFAQIPMNLLARQDKADYVVTGEWSKKAVKEAQAYCDVHIAAHSEDKAFHLCARRTGMSGPMPPTSTIAPTKRSAASSFMRFQKPKTLPLVADASSHILSRPLDVSKFGLIYAGAQKNIGPAGLTIVIVRDDLTGQGAEGHALGDGLQAAGGGRLDAQHARDLRDVHRRAGVQVAEDAGRSGRRWRSATSPRRSCSTTSSTRAPSTSNSVDKEDRSRMNVPFTLADAKLDDEVPQGRGEGRHGAARRATARWAACARSIYNAMPIEGVRQLVAYMKDFGARRG